MMLLVIDQCKIAPIRHENNTQFVEHQNQNKTKFTWHIYNVACSIFPAKKCTKRLFKKNSCTVDESQQQHYKKTRLTHARQSRQSRQSRHQLHTNKPCNTISLFLIHTVVEHSSIVPHGLIHAQATLNNVHNTVAYTIDRCGPLTKRFWLFFAARFVSKEHDWSTRFSCVTQ